MTGRLRVTPRGFAGPTVRFGVPFAALIVALMIGAILLAVSGSDPVEAYRTMFNASLNGWNPLTRTLALATPLIFTGLAAAVAFQMRVYNIGGEGQLYGAGCGELGGALPPADTPMAPMLVAVAVGAVAEPPGRCSPHPKALFNADENTTMMLNFVALSPANYLIFGHSLAHLQRTVPGAAPWTRRSCRNSQDVSTSVSYRHRLRCRVWWCCVAPHGVSNRTIGDSPTSARYAGMSVG